MTTIDAIKDALPDSAKDHRINLPQVLGGETLTPTQKWGTAVACAITTRNAALREAVLNAAKEALPDDVRENALDDARAAAALMGMNNVFYRFRHLVGKESYSQKPARLRMQRIAQPKSAKVDFELMCLAVSTINACEVCIKAHEATCLEGGLTEDAVFDAVRIAAVLQGVALGLESNT